MQPAHNQEVRRVVLAIVLLVFCSSAFAREAADDLVFRRSDGSAIAFPGSIRAWCDRDGLHVLTLGRTSQSRWLLAIARQDVTRGRVVRFGWRDPRGVELFVFDARTRNEASEGAEGSHGRVGLRRATCARGGPLEIGLDGVLASEFGDGRAIRFAGTFRARVGTRPTG